MSTQAPVTPFARVMFVSVLAVCLAVCPAAAQTGALLMVQPFAEGRTVELGSELTFINTGAIKGAGRGDLDIYDGWGRWRLGGEDQRRVTIGFDVTYLDIDAPVATAGTGVTRLVDQSVAVGLAVGAVAGWQLDAVAGVGHSGNLPYSDGQALYALGDLIFTRELDDGASVQLFLNYDGNRGILPDVPLPGIAYHKRVSDTLAYTVGLPLSAVTWQAADSLCVKVDYALPTTVNVRADWTVHPGVSVFGAFVNRLEAFAVTDDRRDRRVFFKQLRAEAGVRWEPCANFGVEVAGGVAFEQRFSRGFDLRDDETIAALTDEPYVKVAVDIGF